MEALDGPSDSQDHQLQYTPFGTPFIKIAIESDAPVYLTPFTPTDEDAVQKIMSLPSLYNHLIAVPQPYTPADAKFWVDLQLSGSGNLPLQVLRSLDPETGHLIGSVALEPITGSISALQRLTPSSDDECELGYYLHPDFRGKGIMKPAVEALLWWAREERGVKTVVVRVLQENRGSRRIVEAIEGFVREEAQDDWIDWPEKKGGGRRRMLVWRWRG